MNNENYTATDYENALTEYLKEHDEEPYFIEISDTESSYSGPREPDQDTYEVEIKNYLLKQGGEFVVMTVEQADRDAKESIRDSLYYFSPEYLADYAELPPEVFKAISESVMHPGGLGEREASEVIQTLIDRVGTFDHFCEVTIAIDDYGHFISPYDGETFRADNGLYVFLVD